MINLAKRIFKDVALLNKVTIILFSFLIFFLNTSFCVYAGEENRFRFAVMGSMHLGVSDAKDYELAVEKIKEHKPDFVLFLGDMVDPMVDKPVESLWKEFDCITDKLGIPVYNIFSHCRLVSSFIPKDRMALMEKCFLDRYKKRYYSFIHKNNLFICLDSESLFVNEKEGALNREQLDFLKTNISDATKYDNAFLFVHRLSPFTERETLEAYLGKGAWFTAIHPIIKGKVKYVFSVYRHRADIKKIDDVNYIFSGYPPVLPVNQSSFPHFLIIDVDKERSSIELIPVQPIVIDNTDKIITVYKTYMMALPDREKILQPSRIIDSLKIKPGMNILDIGAGAGFFTFRFAEALAGTGKVFAADADPMMIRNIENRIKETKFKNIFPVLVQGRGLDPFYKQNSFDIIFLLQTYHNLLNAKDYFRELIPSLEKKGGRLYIIDYKDIADFSEMEFDDFKQVAETLISEGEKFPIFQRLDKDVQYFIKNWQGEDVAAKIRRQIILSFNRMLSDGWLWPDLLDYYSSQEKQYMEHYIWGDGELLMNILKFRDLRLAKWLVCRLDEERVFNREHRILNDIDKKQLHALNRMLIAAIFQTDTLNELQGIDKSPIYVGKNSIISTLESAGFKFVREYDFLAYHYFLEFKREF